MMDIEMGLKLNRPQNLQPIFDTFTLRLKNIEQSIFNTLITFPRQELTCQAQE